MKRFILLLVHLWVAITCASSQTTLSLEAYKDSVLSYNQTIQIASRTVDAAKAAAKEIKTAYFPGVDASASYNYNFNPPVLSLGTVKEELYAANWRAGGEISQNIYTGGRLSGAYNAARIQQDIAGLAEELSVDNISYTAEVTYWNVAASHAYLDISERYRVILKDLYDVVLTRFNDGLISKTDVLKAETSLKQAEYQVSKAEQTYVNSCILFNVLMGTAPGTTIVLSDSIQDWVPAPGILTLEDVLNRRPDYRIKSREIDLQKQQGNIDRSEFLPKMSIGASVDYGTPRVNITGDPLWAPIVYAKVNIPVFYWGKSKQSRDKNKALIISKELSLSLAEDDIKKDFRTALNNMTESSRQIDIARENMKTAGESLDLHTFSYREGHLSILDVQAAQISWLQAYVSLIESFLNNKLAISDYKKVIAE